MTMADRSEKFGRRIGAGGHADLVLRQGAVPALPRARARRARRLADDPTLAHGRPAAAYHRAADGTHQAFGVAVLEVTPAGIARITVFPGGPELVESFGLATTRTAVPA